MQAPTFFNAENRRDAESAERERQASQDEQRRRMQAPTFFNAENRRDAESAERKSRLRRTSSVAGCKRPLFLTQRIEETRRAQREKKQASQDEQRRRMQAPTFFNAENRRDAESAEREKAGFAGRAASQDASAHFF